MSSPLGRPCARSASSTIAAGVFDRVCRRPAWRRSTRSGPEQSPSRRSTAPWCRLRSEGVNAQAFGTLDPPASGRDAPAAALTMPLTPFRQLEGLDGPLVWNRRAGDISTAQRRHLPAFLFLMVLVDSHRSRPTPISPNRRPAAPRGPGGRPSSIWPGWPTRAGCPPDPRRGTPLAPVRQPVRDLR